jgi:hypothetical protein
MARRGDMTSLGERLTIRDRAADGATDATIAAELRRSIWTVRTGTAYQQSDYSTLEQR